MDPRTLFSDGQRGSLKIESIRAAELEIQIRRGTSPARRTFHSIIDTQRERPQRDIRYRGANRFDRRSREFDTDREKGRNSVGPSVNRERRYIYIYVYIYVQGVS